MPAFRNLTGLKFNKLTALQFWHFGPRKNAHWLYLCDCGTYKVINAADVTYGMTKSCGCLRNSNH